MIRIEYSTMCFNETSYRQKIEQARDFVRKQGFDFGIQIHNSIDEPLFNKVLEFKDEIPFSVHSPVFANHFLNLAASDFKIIQDTCDNCTRYLSQLNTDLFFFHGFFMTDRPIIHDMKNYRKTIRAGIGDQYCLKGSFIMDPGIFSTESFTRYRQSFQSNLSRVKEMYNNFTIALENDFPGIGSGLQRPEEIHDLIENLWFDLGHFWCSAMLHGFDFQEESMKILQQKNIVGYHLNHNLVKSSTPKEMIRDSHTHFYLESEMNLKPIVRKIFEINKGVVVLEIVDGDLKDLEILFDWLE